MKKAVAALVLIGCIMFGTTQMASARSHQAFSSRVYKTVASGKCNWLKPLIAKAGLPSVFVYISARESGCARNGVRVANRTDLSTSRFGLNFRGSMPRYWKKVCGVSDWTALRNVSLDLKCTKAAYKHSGLRPWAVR